jgi:Tol biopolymer transport system component
MNALSVRIKQMPAAFPVILGAPVITLLLLLVTGGGVLLGRLYGAHEQILYISQADPLTDNHVTLFLHDLASGIRLPLIKDYLGWGSVAAWSPDGRRIAYSRFREDVVQRDIVVYDLYTGEETVISDDVMGSDYNAPDWSPDGQKLAYHGVDASSGSIDLYMYDLANRQQRKLYAGPLTDAVPAWSPDGQQIAFESRNNFDWPPNIYLLDLATETAVALAPSMTQQTAPTWSPDGRSIAFASLYGGNSTYGIYMIDVDKSRFRQLVRFLYLDTAEPHWSPDGQSLLYTRFEFPGSRIYRVPITGSPIRPITEADGNYRQPFWRP